MNRKDDNWTIGRKVTVQDVAEYRESLRQQEAEADRIEVEMTARGEVVVNGLVQKYGFSEKGARTTLGYIKRMRIDDARFATEEMKQAAYAAYDWFWK